MERKAIIEFADNNYSAYLENINGFTAPIIELNHLTKR